MSPLRTDSLLHLLADALATGHDRIGQVAMRATADGAFVLRHVDDEDQADLEDFHEPFDAQRIALLDDSGKYRPLKTAPNLRRGWRLTLRSLQDLRVALDHLYPAALGNWRARLTETLVPVPLRETVNRQTGMYRITGKISTEQACWLRGQLCEPGCLRRILWSVEPGEDAHATAIADANAIPLLCGEVCNLYVAAARKVVKGIPLDQVE